MRIIVPVFYFGCVGKPGHYWFAEGLGPVYGDDGDGYEGPRGHPWRPTNRGGLGIDGKLAPRSTHPTPADRIGPGVYEVAQGLATLHHVAGWTALSFWDRSVDHRGASNSNFITHDVVSFDDMELRCRAAFPEVWSRFPFKVRLHQ